MHQREHCGKLGEYGAESLPAGRREHLLSPEEEWVRSDNQLKESNHHQALICSEEARLPEDGVEDRAWDLVCDKSYRPSPTESAADSKSTCDKGPEKSKG
jgi:hypothetical protein